ncbi:MAG: zinc-ribbon domain-containing protein, partial [Myxococcaceae bacterium]|nr:zinc-ribbon domain-containing protein [Myxococcaceae bacterium]
CQKCSAAYAIDDKFVTEKGVRAQCPRCRHLQMVKKGDDASAPAAAPPPPAAGASPFLFDLPGAPAPAPAPAAAAPPPGAGSPFDFSFAAPPPPAPAPAPAPAPLAAPTTRSPFDFDLVAPPPPAAPKPMAPPVAMAPPAPPPPPAMPAFPPMPPPPPVGFPAFGDAATEPPGFEFGAPPPGAPSTTSAALDDLTGGAAAKCKSCGKAISDPFDIALGTCDDCRNKQQERVEAPTPDSEAGRSERVDVASIAKSVTASAQRGLQPVPIPIPQTTTEPAPMSVAQSNSVRSAMRANAASNRSRTLVAVVVGLVVVGAIGGLLAWKRPWVRRPPRSIVPTNPVASQAIEDIVKKWKIKYVDLADEDSGNARAHVEAGEAALDRDTTSGYREAEEEFEKALVLDTSSDRAIAGWALAVAFGRRGEIDELTSKAADSMLAAAEKRSGGPGLYAAHAHLDIARGVNLNDIEYRANLGKNSKEPREKALALLAIGHTQLVKNPTVAEQLFKEALALDAKQKRAYLFQAQLATSLGKYREAVDALEKRLQLDADQWEASETLARLQIEFGDVARARKVLDEAVTAAPKNLRAKLAVAMLAYQHQLDYPGAIEGLSQVLNAGNASGRERAEASSHLATVYRLQGELERAKDAANKALELQPDHVGARVQLLLVLIDTGVLSQARLTLDSLAEKLPAGLQQQLEGRLLLAEGRLAEAQTTLMQLVDKDGSQAGALLLAGAAAAKARKDGKAWELCLKRGLKLDPYSNPLPPLTSTYVRQADLLKPAVGAWAALSSGGDEDPNPHLCEGLVAWFSEDFGAAERQFARVTAIDPKNADGFAYRALLALRKKDLGTALTQANRAVGANKQHALAHFALSVTQMAANRVDAAKVAATLANKFGPSLLGPRVVMGDAEARQNGKDAARKLLSAVLLSDPWYRDAKRVLFKHAL